MDIARHDRHADHETDIAAHEATYRAFLRLIRTAAAVVALVLIGLAVFA